MAEDERLVPELREFNISIVPLENLKGSSSFILIIKMQKGLKSVEFKILVNGGSTADFSCSKTYDFFKKNSHIPLEEIDLILITGHTPYDLGGLVLLFNNYQASEKVSCLPRIYMAEPCVKFGALFFYYGFLDITRDVSEKLASNNNCNIEGFKHSESEVEIEFFQLGVPEPPRKSLKFLNDFCFKDKLRVVNFLEEVIDIGKPWISEGHVNDTNSANQEDHAVLKLKPLAAGNSLTETAWLLSFPSITINSTMLVTSSLNTAQKWFYDGFDPTLLSRRLAYLITTFPLVSPEGRRNQLTRRNKVEQIESVKERKEALELENETTEQLFGLDFNVNAFTDSYYLQRTLNDIRETIGKGGSVLFPMEFNFNMLKLLIIFESKLSISADYPVIFLCKNWKVFWNVLKNSMDFLSLEIREQFTKFRENPFSNFRHIQFESSGGFFEKRLNSFTPRVVIATPGTLLRGYSQRAFLTLCENPLSKVIFLEEPTKADKIMLKNYYMARKKNQSLKLEAIRKEFSLSKCGVHQSSDTKFLEFQSAPKGMRDSRDLFVSENSPLPQCSSGDKSSADLDNFARKESKVNFLWGRTVGENTVIRKTVECYTPTESCDEKLYDKETTSEKIGDENINDSKKVTGGYHFSDKKLAEKELRNYGISSLHMRRLLANGSIEEPEVILATETPYTGYSEAAKTGPCSSQIKTTLEDRIAKESQKIITFSVTVKCSIEISPNLFMEESKYGYFDSNQFIKWLSFSILQVSTWNLIVLYQNFDETLLGFLLKSFQDTNNFRNIKLIDTSLSGFESCTQKMHLRWYEAWVNISDSIEEVLRNRHNKLTAQNRITSELSKPLSIPLLVKLNVALSEKEYKTLSLPFKTLIALTSEQPTHLRKMNFDTSTKKNSEIEVKPDESNCLQARKSDAADNLATLCYIGSISMEGVIREMQRFISPRMIKCTGGKLVIGKNEASLRIIRGNQCQEAILQGGLNLKTYILRNQIEQLIHVRK